MYAMYAVTHMMNLPEIRTMGSNLAQNGKMFPATLLARCAVWEKTNSQKNHKKES